MLRTLRGEARKLFTVNKILIFSLSVIISCLFVCFVEKNIADNSLTPVGIENYTDFMEFNITFLLVKILFPLSVACLTASSITGEYESGMTKNFLLTGIIRTDYIIGKIIILMFFCIVTALLILLFLSVSYPIIWQMNIRASEIYNIAILYIRVGISAFPIIAVSSLISVCVDNFLKTVFISVGLIFLSVSLDSVIGKNYLTPTSFLSGINDTPASFTFVAIVYAIPFFVITVLSFNRKNIWA
jgi:ABC-type transport system involved in multi-copper enzyme maturation permease subunit